MRIHHHPQWWFPIASLNRFHCFCIACLAGLARDTTCLFLISTLMSIQDNSIKDVCDVFPLSSFHNFRVFVFLAISLALLPLALILILSSLAHYIVSVSTIVYTIRCESNWKCIQPHLCMYYVMVPHDFLMPIPTEGPVYHSIYVLLSRYRYASPFAPYRKSLMHDATFIFQRRSEKITEL